MAQSKWLSSVFIKLPYFVNKRAASLLRPPVLPVLMLKLRGKDALKRRLHRSCEGRSLVDFLRPSFGDCRNLTVTGRSRGRAAELQNSRFLLADRCHSRTQFFEQQRERICFVKGVRQVLVRQFRNVHVLHHRLNFHDFGITGSVTCRFEESVSVQLSGGRLQRAFPVGIEGRSGLLGLCISLSLSAFPLLGGVCNLGLFSLTQLIDLADKLVKTI